MSARAAREIRRIGGLRTPKFAMAQPAMASLALRRRVKLHRAQLTVLCADHP